MNADEALRFDPEHFAIARARMTSSPLELTEHDHAMLAIVSRALEADAREAQRQAQLAIVQANAPTVATRSTAKAASPEKMKEFAVFMKGIAGPIVEVIKKSLDARVGPLEARIAALEAKPHVKFCGVWRAGGTYGPGDAATHHGSLWICQAAPAGEPSKDYVGWQLAVKRGAA